MLKQNFKNHILLFFVIFVIGCTEKEKPKLQLNINLQYIDIPDTTFQFSIFKDSVFKDSVFKSIIKDSTFKDSLINIFIKNLIEERKKNKEMNEQLIESYHKNYIPGPCLTP